MSSKAMELAVWVRLKDRFSGKLRGLIRGFNKLGKVARRIGAVGAIIGALSFTGPANEAAAFDQSIRDIGVTAGKSLGQVEALIRTAGGAYEDLALKTSQASVDIAKTAGDLIASGMNETLLQALLPSIAKTATATSSEIRDIGKVAFALSKNLGIPADRMQDALGKLVIAGKEGRFELKEMAKYFPALTSQLVSFGIKGEEAVSMLASGLQIAILGASDPAQAANNFQNFLQKVLAPDTVKRFAKNGVDILAVMQDAATKGINPIEAVIAKTEDLTGVTGKVINDLMLKAKANGLEGAEGLKVVHEQLERIGAAGKLAELFGDQQVKAFLLPFLANINEYKRIKDLVDGADRGVIDVDAAIQLAGPQAQKKLFNELGTQSGRDFGDAFNSWLPTVNKYLLELRGNLKELESGMPGIKDKILSFAMAGVAAMLAIGALGLAVPVVAAGIKVLAGAFALAFSPIGLTIIAIAGGAYLIMRNWDLVGPYFEAIWDGIKTGATAALEVIKSGFTSFMEGLVPEIDLSKITIDDAKAAGITVLAGALELLKSAWTEIQSFGAGFGSGFMAELDGALEPLSRLGEPLKSVGKSLRSIGESIASLFGSMDSNPDAASQIGEFMGQFLGNSLGVAASAIKLIADSIAFIFKSAEELTKLLTGQPVDWSGLVGSGDQVFKSLGELIDSTAKLIGDFIGMDLTIDWSGLKGDLEAVVDWIADQLGWLKEYLSGFYLGGAAPQIATPSANDNSSIRNRAADANKGGDFNSLVPRQEVQVGGQITIKVEGPGKVTSIKSSNAKVPVTANRGKVIGAH